MSEQQMREACSAFLDSQPDDMYGPEPLPGRKRWKRIPSMLEVFKAGAEWQAAMRASGERTGKESFGVSGDALASMIARWEADPKKAAALHEARVRLAATMMAPPPSISEAALREALWGDSPFKGCEMYEWTLARFVEALRKLGITITP